MLNKLSVPNGQPTAVPASVENLEEPQKGSSPSHSIATAKPKYRWLLYTCKFFSPLIYQLIYEYPSAWVTHDWS